MSKRPSASFNDPGYFYSQRRLLKIFALSSVALMVGLLAMIWQDFDREWKDSQRAALVWEASRATLENMILRTMTVEKRAEMAAERKAAHDAIEARNEELTKIRSEIRDASGADYNARLLYNAKKQFTGQAEYQVNEARNDEDRAYWAKQLRKERDSEHRLRDDAQRTTERLNLLVNREKAIQKGLDDVIAKERANPKLKRMSLLAAAIAKKRGYNPLREIPLLDFLAPPTKVEQIVLDDLVDNYEFSMPKKVDRCGTCHIGAMPFAAVDPPSCCPSARARRAA